MTDRDQRRVRGAAPPPPDFDPLTADQKELAHYGLPLRPDPQTQPGLAALWERQAGRYRHFDHLAVKVPRPEITVPGSAASPRLSTRENCGYELTSFGDPLTALFVTWTVPNLRYTTNPAGPITFHTFVQLGFLDVHVEMTVDAAQNVTAQLGGIALPVAPGDVLSAALCLGTEPPGRATYVLANETRSQTTSFSFDTGWPPAVTAAAGISRGNAQNPFNALAQFGIVYFDEISVYTRHSGFRSLTRDGQATTMTDQNGKAIARPYALNDFAFKVVHSG
jgi:hypothetical protein